MSCLGDCMESGPPPNTILLMPPPPAPSFFLSSTSHFFNISHCSITQICDTTSSLLGTGKVAVDQGQYREVSGKDIEVNWAISGIDDTWLLVLVASSVGVLLLGALLALFLLKCREMSLFDGLDRCSLHTRSQRQSKISEPRESSIFVNGNKLILPSETLFSQGSSSIQDNRLVWAALTPRGTQHFISENYPGNFVEYGTTENHYETIDPLGVDMHSTSSNPGINTYYKDYNYEDPVPLIDCQMNRMDSSSKHHLYQRVGELGASSEDLNFGLNTLKNYHSLTRPRVSPPTRIEHPNLPPLNLYPHKTNNNSSRRNTMNYRNVNGSLTKYGI